MSTVLRVKYFSVALPEKSMTDNCDYLSEVNANLKQVMQVSFAKLIPHTDLDTITQDDKQPMVPKLLHTSLSLPRRCTSDTVISPDLILYTNMPTVSREACFLPNGT